MGAVGGRLLRRGLWLLLPLAAVLALETPAVAGVLQPTVVSTTPLSGTPNLKTGYIVHDDAVVNGIVYVGGQFTQFENAARNVTYNRQNFMAYSASTGAVQPLAPSFGSDVQAVLGSPDGSALYVGGNFKTVNGASSASLIRINLATGTIDNAFKWTQGCCVYSLQYAGGKLYVGGTFAKHLVAVDPLTGADTGTVAVSVAGQLDSNTATKITKIAVNPSGSSLVAIGNFTTVNGLSRNAGFRLSLPTTGQTALTDWHPTRFNVLCSVRNWPRDVDWAPDGSYFVIVGSGGPSGGYPATGFCDAAGRWEASSSGSTAQPTWINWTGGDTLLSVAVSGAAVYVGGHERWLDNPSGHDSAGPGAFQVDSIGAINPTTGAAIRTWNADYMDRNHGKEDLTLYSGGLVVGGDGTYLKGIYHKGTGISPSPSPSPPRPTEPRR